MSDDAKQEREVTWNGSFGAVSVDAEITRLRDALKKTREALGAAPLLGRTESVNDFMARQNAWLNGPYRAALEQSK